MREKYYAMYLATKVNGKDAQVKEWPHVLGTSENEDCLKSMPILGISNGDELKEFFSQSPVSSTPCKGLTYTMLLEMPRDKFLKLTSKLTDAEKKRGVKRAKDFEKERIEDFGKRK